MVFQAKIRNQANEACSARNIILAKMKLRPAKSGAVSWSEILKQPLFIRTLLKG